MHLADVLTFFNRIGVRVVNDVTAQVTAEITAAMDPEGMGVHMGSEAPSAGIEMASRAELSAKESSFVTKGDFGDEMKGWQSALVAVSDIVTDNCMKVVVQKVTELTAYADKHAANLMARMDDKMGQEGRRMDKNMTDLEQRMEACNNKHQKLMDAKDAQHDQLIASIQRERPNKMKSPVDNQGDNGSKMQTMHDKSSATVKSKDKQRRSKEHKRDTTNTATDTQRDSQDAQRDSQDAQRDSKDAQRDSKDAQRNQSIVSIQHKRSKGVKRPAGNQGDNGSKMQTMHDKSPAAVKSKDKQRSSKKHKRDTKNAATDAQRDSQDAQRDSQDAQCKQLMASIQSLQSNDMKRPADNQGDNKIPKKSRPAKIKECPPNISRAQTGSKLFRWDKTIDKTPHYQTGFKTLEETEKAMAVYLNELYA